MENRDASTRSKPTYTINKDAPNLVGDSEGFVVGIVTRWNLHGVGEVIVQYFDGSASSEFFSELTFPNGKDEAMDWLNAREL